MPNYGNKTTAFIYYANYIRLYQIISDFPFAATSKILYSIQLPHFEPMLAIFQLSVKRLREGVSQVKAKRRF